MGTEVLSCACVGMPVPVRVHYVSGSAFVCAGTARHRGARKGTKYCCRQVQISMYTVRYVYRCLDAPRGLSICQDGDMADRVDIKSS
jgi:hypothetical protein